MDYLILTNDHPEWLKVANTIRQFDWKAAKYTADKMAKHEFTDWESVIIAKEKDEIVGFCTLVKKDIIYTNEYTPNIATVFVTPAYRGNHISKELVEIGERRLTEIGFRNVYITTQHEGLYEKWGYKEVSKEIDQFARLMRVLEKNLIDET
ncbi:GNAT family N-acetyltransferase [Candidatus Enterococcus mangumiae]|uniref:N-acetyltransferase domain-containing protein n=1 Tax=Candidatus Enterococcus mangumiae TaxID=2230878 RepID=A0ABZ2T0I4_9ENTE|nr:GNAT family N-acetyltransferase [Enterococcus sp. DIV1094]MBO0491155.1 GNAT family N-acetyltransferase [Enterococcus sp. DIV1094]